jgi:hypothetical protein
MMKGLFLMPIRAPPKKTAKESKKTPKKEAKEKNKKQKGETQDNKGKAKKDTPASTETESKSNTDVVPQKKQEETPKESTGDGTPFSNSSNKPSDDKTNVTEQSLAISTSPAEPQQVASTKTAGAVQTPKKQPKSKKNKKSKKAPVPAATDVPKSSSDTENKEEPLIALIREQSLRQNKKSRDPLSMDESDTPRGIDP